MRLKMGFVWALMVVLTISLLPIQALAAVAAQIDPAECTHRWSLVDEKEATCQEEGYKTYHCWLCGSEKTEKVKKLKHDYGKWKVTREATCDREGERVRRCKVCDHRDTQKIDKLSHTWGEWTILKSATCTEEGEGERTCEVCGYVDHSALPMLAHDFGPWEIALEATDHSKGRRERTCAVCGTVEQQDFDPEGTLRRGDKGDEVKDLQEGLICYGALRGRADGSYGGMTEAAVRQVQTAEGFEVDGVAWPQTRGVLGHRFTPWEITKPMTREEDGERTRTCLRCGLVERDPIEASPMILRGARGKDVEFIQNALIDLGFDPGRPDGDFGRRTEQAIVDWSHIRPEPIRPGRLRPIDIDNLLDEWIKLQPIEEMSVRLRFTLTPRDTGATFTIGEKLTFDWSVTNEGSEDCTLGPILMTYGKDNLTQDVTSIFNTVVSLSGQLLMANGGNTLTGSFSIVPTGENVTWMEEDEGDLYINARAVGVSTVSRERVLSNVESVYYSFRGDPAEPLPDDEPGGLILQVEQLTHKATYRVGDEISFRWTVTNTTDEDMTLWLVDVGTPDDQGLPISEKRVVLPAHGAATASDTYVLELYDDWIYTNPGPHEGSWWIYFTAQADPAGGGKTIGSNYVEFFLPQAGYEPVLHLAVEQISDRQVVYADGEEVSFRWTLTNTGDEALTLQAVEMGWCDNTVMTVSDEAQPMSPGGSISGDWTLTLDGDHTVDDAWRPYFEAVARIDATGQSRYSNGVLFELTPATLKPNSLPIPAGISTQMKSLTPPEGMLSDNEAEPMWRSLTVVEQSKKDSDYRDGAAIPVTLRLTLDSYDDYTWQGVNVYEGDYVSHEGWMDEKLEAGQSYDFVYTMVLDPEKTGWAFRTVTVDLLSMTTFEREQESCRVEPPFTLPSVSLGSTGSDTINDIDAYLYLHLGVNAISGYRMEWVSIPFSLELFSNTGVTVKNLKLHCLTDTNGDQWYSDVRSIPGAWKANCKESLVNFFPTRQFEDRLTGYTMTFYATGEYYNKKGKLQTVESKKITVPMTIKRQEDSPGALALKFSIDPKKDTYTANEKVNLHLTVTNTGQRELGNVTVEMTDAFKPMAYKLPLELGVPDKTRLMPGESAHVDAVYRISKDDADKQAFTFGLIARGVTTDTGKAVQSYTCLINKPVERKVPPDAISLTVRMASAQDFYAVNTDYTAMATVQNAAAQGIVDARIYAVGDNRYETHGEDAECHDEGHGAKGFLCGHGGEAGIGDALEIPVQVRIPLFLKGSAKYHPAWIAEATLKDGTVVRSELAALTLPIGEMTTPATLSLGVQSLTFPPGPEGTWYDGSKAQVHLSAAYEGSAVPYLMSVVITPVGAGEPAASEVKHAVTTLDADLEFEVDSQYAVDGKVIYACSAYTQDAPGGPHVLDAKTSYLTFRMAPDQGGSETPEDPQTQINWDAIHEAVEAGGDEAQTPGSGEGSEDLETPTEKEEGAAGAETSEEEKSSGEGKTSDEVKPEEGAESSDGGKSSNEVKPADDEKPSDDGKPTDDGKPSDEAKPAEDGKTELGFEEEAIILPGPEYDIPATLCLPAGQGPFPAVVMLHGTGSSRDEAGDAYKFAAPILAREYGIATIRIDFPGNGDSTADYLQYNFDSAVADALSAAEYIAGLENIDANAIGVMGWSQGGTDALLCCAWHPEVFKSLVTWAGAPDLRLDDFFTEADYEEARKNGYFVMEFDWREDLKVSLEWCEDVLNTDVLKIFAEGYDGPVLAVAGTLDDTVDPVWSRRIVEANGNVLSRVYMIEGMDHTFNVFTEADLHSLRQAVEATGGFFSETLGQD